MKTSKLLITSLLAAAALSVPAYADDVSGEVAVSAANSTAYVMTDDTTFTFTNNPTLTGSISGAYTLTTSGNATLATGFGGTGDTRWTDGNLIVSAGTLQWGEGSRPNPATANQTKALGETISVSSGAALKIHLWTGKDFDTSTDGKVNITSKIILNGTSTLETADGSYYFSGGIQVGDGSTEGTATFRANWNKAIVISSLSGSGTMNFVGANTAYDAPIFSLGGNGGFSGALNVTSTSLHLTSENAASGATLNIAGGASLYLDATTNNVKGLSGSGSVVATAGNTLAIATENGVTNTFSGTVGTSTSAVGLSISGSGTQTLAGTSYLGTVSVTGGSLSLGGTVSLANTVSVSGSGSVSVNDSVIFILNDNYKSDNTWTLISGASSVGGWSSLTPDNFRKTDGSFFSGRSEINVGTSGAVSITEGTSASLVWNGTSGNSTWNTSTAIKNWTNDNLSSEDKADSFYTLDNVTFKSLENVFTTVTLENGADLTVGEMKVTGDSSYIVDVGADNNMATIAGAKLTIDSGSTLQVGQSAGGVARNVKLDFDSISLGGTLKLQTKSTDSWRALTFASEGAHLHIYDIGGSETSAGLAIDGIVMDAAGKISSDWGKLVTIGSVSGSANLTIEGPSAAKWAENIVYRISSLQNYTGTLSTTAGRGTGTLTVEISGDNSSFTGMLEINAGTVRLGSNGNVLGATKRKAAVVKTGGTLNINGKGVFYKFELAGGSLVNNGAAIEKGAQQLEGLSLSADSSVGGTGTFGLISSNWMGNTLDLAGFTLTKTGSNEFLLASTTVKSGTIDVRQGTLTVMNGNDAVELFSMDSGALIKLNGGTLKATVPTGSLTSVKLGDVAVVLTDKNKDAERITADSSCTFNAGGATLYLDIGALTDTVLTGDEVALTIAGANVISAENFFNTVLVGTYDSGDNWINDTEWAYKADSWDASTGTLYLISVPEPSAFGLLAGAGALALVAARRRRTKKA